MRNALVGLLFLMFAIPSTLQAQDAFNGKWEAEVASERIVFEFQVKEGKVTGSITRVNVRNPEQTKLEGVLEKETIRFAVKNGDGTRTIKFSGKLSGDSILFDREVTLNNPEARPGGPGIYGMGGPATLTAKRLKE
jgi:hypothetical protein